ncbi:hypothetical protein [Rhodococcus sp. (in: high G+C Gram-positive bacteria)]|uniref:hypothetical protein n=1 Tax=Rhodococcus sp. TaxID=1831 RepID=UPI003B8A6F75
MSSERQSMRESLRRRAWTAMVVCPAVTVAGVMFSLCVSVSAGGDSHGWFAAALAAGMVVTVVAAVAGLMASLVWLLAAPGRPEAGAAVHGPVQVFGLRERESVARAARAMSDAELEEAVRALADTEDRLLAQGRVGEAERVAADLRVCLSVFGRRQQSGGATAP